MVLYQKQFFTKLQKKDNKVSTGLHSYLTREFIDNFKELYFKSVKDSGKNKNGYKDIANVYEGFKKNKKNKLKVFLN